MDESNCRGVRPGAWARWLGLVSLSLWLAGCTPLPVDGQAREPALSTCAAGAAGAAASGCAATAATAAAAPQPAHEAAEPQKAPKEPRAHALHVPRPVLRHAVEAGASTDLPGPSAYELSPPRESDQQGLASWYGSGFHGRRTASGERFDSQDLTAAHRTLAFGTRVCVRSAITGKAVVVRINDRGPFSNDRVIDLSEGAAEALGMIGLGIKPVELWQLDKDEEDCPEMFDEARAGRNARAPGSAARVHKRSRPAPRKKAVAPRPRRR